MLCYNISNSSAPVEYCNDSFETVSSVQIIGHTLQADKQVNAPMSCDNKTKLTLVTRRRQTYEGHTNGGHCCGIGLIHAYATILYPSGSKVPDRRKTDTEIG